MMKTKILAGLAILVALALVAWLCIALLQHFSVNFIAPILPPVAGTVRVACVGDSTTYGMMLWNRAHNNYPAKLQALLGDGFSVRNYAANSTTVLSTGDHPYRDHKVYRLSAEFDPDIVLIMLGTNDAKPEIWTDLAAFRADYHALVEYYVTLPGGPVVYLMTPPSVIPRGDKVGYDINLQVLGEIADVVREEAESRGLPLIDIHRLTAGQGDLFSGIDGAHPNSKGAALIAETVYATLLEQGVDVPH